MRKQKEQGVKRTLNLQAREEKIRELQERKQLQQLRK